jgi:hypothetical protein
VETPPSDSFTTADVYAFARELEKLHPDMVQIGFEQKATPTRREHAEETEMFSFSCSKRSPLSPFTPVETRVLLFHVIRLHSVSLRQVALN